MEAIDLEKLIQKDTGFKCNISQHSELINKIIDNVNSPSHYTQGGIETIDFIKSRLTREEFIGALKFNILKYCSRSNLKNGEEDLRKMNYYSNCLIEVLNEKV